MPKTDTSKQESELKSILESVYYQDIDVEEAIKRIIKIKPNEIEVVTFVDSGGGCRY